MVPSPLLSGSFPFSLLPGCYDVSRFPPPGPYAMKFLHETSHTGDQKNVGFFPFRYFATVPESWQRIYEFSRNPSTYSTQRLPILNQILTVFTGRCSSYSAYRPLSVLAPELGYVSHLAVGRGKHMDTTTSCPVSWCSSATAPQIVVLRKARCMAQTMQSPALLMSINLVTSWLTTLLCGGTPHF